MSSVAGLRLRGRAVRGGRLRRVGVVSQAGRVVGEAGAAEWCTRRVQASVANARRRGACAPTGGAEVGGQREDRRLTVERVPRVAAGRRVNLRALPRPLRQTAMPRSGSLSPRVTGGPRGTSGSAERPDRPCSIHRVTTRGHNRQVAVGLGAGRPRGRAPAGGSTWVLEVDGQQGSGRRHGARYSVVDWCVSL